jgi:hypothetical protein
MDAQLGRRVIGLIFGLTVRDGKMTDSETAFIHRAHAALGVPMDRSAWTLPVADPDEAAAELRAMPKEVQREALGLLVEAAAVDGVVHPREREFLEAAAKAIGWTSAQLEEQLVNALSTDEGS